MTEIKCALAHASRRAVRVVLIGIGLLMIWKAIPPAQQDPLPPARQMRATHAPETAPARPEPSEGLPHEHP